MSVEVLLIPLAIGIVATRAATKTAMDAMAAEHYGVKEIQPRKRCIKMDTRFKDSNLLLKTLNEYGLKPKKTSSGGYTVKFSDGDILYSRSSADATFTMTITNIKDKNALIKDLLEIEQEYNGNVQEYTYKRILNHLPEGMEIENEEVLEDNSILITLSVD